jgi:hypothetical protein
MKLNPDCIRDILLEVEKSATFELGLFLDKDSGNSLFDKYSWSEIAYHLDQCTMANLLTYANIYYADEYADVGNLTPAGHEFIANIRQDTNWNKTKQIAKKVGSFSLSAIKDIASNVISEIVKSNFQ